MPKVDGERDFVTWGDVYELVRWLEAGYGGRVYIKMAVGCPPGEQRLISHWEAFLGDDSGSAVALSGRALGRFPNSASRTVPALLLGMLYALDNIASKERLWTEPQIAVKPQRGHT